jgi:hypothetical protein
VKLTSALNFAVLFPERLRAAICISVLCRAERPGLAFDRTGSIAW